ncbi:ACP S-malonyltransferase [Numidum massiliense]|uniref:ACP S-malonyltransferase n=1 Tax=Numidum massiliense TaxID=1522315 RepID=UPI0006D5B740|nr:ACP S-malonyltransferase [Numidum massiliense]
MNKTVFMFPGQGSQYVGMGKYWYDRYESVRRRFDEASEQLRLDLVDLCFNGPATRLNQTENTQPALLTLSVAMFETIREEAGIQPDYLAGHSIGELSALTAAGVFRFRDAVRLARARGEAMAACDAGVGAGMVAITNFKAADIEAVLTELDPGGYEVQIANYNSPVQSVLSGSKDGLEMAGEKLRELGANVIPLNVSGPFHSRFMVGASEALATALEDITVGEMSIPVICGHKGRLYAKNDDIKIALVNQLTAAVRWTDVLSTLSNEDVEKWIEVGPKDVLKNLALKTLPGVEVYAYDNDDDREVLTSLRESKDQLPNLFGLCLGAAVCTRNTNWDETAYRQGVIEPYQKIQALYEQVEKEERVVSKEDMSYALSLLDIIFETKGTPTAERRRRFRHILETTQTTELFPQYVAMGEEAVNG